VILLLHITNILLPWCFLIMSVGKTEKIEFKSLQHTFDPTYSVEFFCETKHVKWFNRKY
jgi:hypothetical protein